MLKRPENTPQIVEWNLEYYFLEMKSFEWLLKNHTKISSNLYENK